MAAEFPPPQHTLLSPGLVSSYNISFNLTSLFTYPSRFLARLINKGDLESASAGLMDATTTSWIDSSETSSMAAAAATSTTTRAAKTATAIASTNAFPAPWGFFSSGYMCGLLIMGVLMHRIDNIFVPTMPTTFGHHHPSHNSHPNRSSYTGSLLNRFLPIDINRTSTRLAIHLPTIYLMCRVLLLWGIMLLQTAQLFPWTTHMYSLAESDSGNFSQNVLNILYRLGKWTASWETGDVCWHTFCAICAAFCVEGFVKGLDGNGFGLGFAEHMQANTSPFNLVGYAFLLHIYSSPLTHAFKAHKPDYNTSDVEPLPSRPDTHVLITLAIPLLQLTLFHLLSVRKRWSRHRLLPTALASMLSLMHFHVTLIKFMMSTPSSSLPSTLSPTYTEPITTPLSSYTLHATPSPNTISAYTYTPHHTTHGYPILNYIPNIFETLLISTIILTIFLNSLTQLLMTGRVDKPLLGLGVSSIKNLDEWKSMIPWEEDFGVVLLRVGTASLEATGLRGWGNEVGGVVASSLPDNSDDESRKYGRVRLTRMGVVGVTPGSVSQTDGKQGHGKLSNGKGRGKPKLLKGWHNEVRDVDLGSPPSSSGSRRQWGINGILTLNAQWFIELGRFVRSVWGSILGAVNAGFTFGWEVLRGRGSYGNTRRRVQDKAQDRRDAGHSGGENEGESGSEDEDEVEELYRKFVRGESVSFGSDEEQDQDYNMSDTDQADEEEESESQEESEETPLLYADLSNRESTPGASTTTSTMIAHMSYTGSSPLTRNKYASLLKGPHGNNEPSPVGDGGNGGGRSGDALVKDDLQGNRISDSSASGVASGDPGDTRRNCVICTVEPRVIICWPCRCLAMCDSCRESLAARSSASKHRCPCCRRGVEGYSRVFIP
ncbi:hypothetical protein EV359DRAFT_29697 [Lentinula novae-zelandiae]|nr:hypothetical protein EV359DRAFT_29697 [Lentinula novae-zelandiae]